ncbi:MAG TPA: N-acetyl-gamma-glutamyl-phosphate reductase, partial [Candidatus Nitrosotenuis sp.]|nr:N-acetyl-gamma-glutamyl-phosphate reductase [Candidatus Nitrosotenuis sp.]
QEWYGHPHPAPDLLEQAIYGLPELNRQALSQARLVANPGCYPTACILALLPLQGWVDPDSLLCDCKSGVSGAGRPPSERNRYCEVEGSVIPYAAGGTHRHTPEIEQHLGWAWGRSLRVSFTPHLVPARRGILATAYARLVRRADTEEVLERMEQFYRGHPFVRVRPPGSLPATAEVAGSNYCDLGAVVDGRTGRLTVVSALDNLVKGAAGQALQNLNLMLGLEETTGLAQAPLFP